MSWVAADIVATRLGFSLSTSLLGCFHILSLCTRLALFYELSPSSSDG